MLSQNQPSMYIQAVGQQNPLDRLAAATMPPHNANLFLGIHEPKLVHILREFLSAVAGVILRIVVAPAAEQDRHAREIRHRVHLVTEELREEVSGDDGLPVLQRVALSP